ncbi:hypothetical protein COX86_02095 [Candidatus Micrarchaeota archaeon CG_4_10_14_0_2_um_filter_60_11]|nr:MAG: hypothetical protein AUJ16_03980 [Candidatus Micrarchaeota archaeon CG1_02_60_51]PIN95855.1 MAG: hypothetical protein COU39_03810 [Candidatus Micrarchaeota archaeon CG10_big_fil_rev_8_21_14_0_10_60_32]PIO01661.1 MAG: hypothetical protein COT58_03995 [Candidatus Micrarchaeota archaeon CG09_land_8_20_14_0_10_60_16]PIY91951.1 MAG: hypothetical protein COY71_00410 [Candidatus Micrarchaeota archaeon CG_4_10_14_0_8_um_filter_60_7]PIZ90976.1 MAG: hypothetical protein COX86_02095 [Candidatus Mi
MQGKTVLFVNSGSRKKEFTLKRAKELGLRVVLLAPRMTWEKRYADDFVKANNFDHAEALAAVGEFIAAGNKIDGAVTFWEDDVPLMAALCEKFGWIGPTREVAERCRNKYAMREAFRRAAVPSPRHARVKSPEELEKAMKSIGFPAVVKPAWGADSEFVVQVNDEEEAREAFSYISKNAVPKFNPIFAYNNNEFIIEEYMPGIEVSVESVTQYGVTSVIGIAEKKLMREPYFVEEGDSAPSRFEGETLDKIRELVLKAHAALGVRESVTHSEIKVTPDGPKMVEVAARMGGDYIWDWVNTIWGVDLVQEALSIALGEQVNRTPQPPKCFLSARYFNSEKSGVVCGIRGWQEAKGNAGLHDFYLDKEVGDVVLAPPEGFESVGWIACKGNTLSEAEKSLDELFNSVEVTIAKYDVGSSVGQTHRKNKFSYASVTRNRLLSGEKINRLKYLPNEDLHKLHVGILCNRYETNGDDNPVESDLTSVGENIQKALEEKGYKATFFDMNEYPLPVEKMQKAHVDVVFNVCERVNDSSLLEPHSAALMDMLQIPYTGSTPFTLALCIDKIRVKKLLSFHDIPTPKWDYVYEIDDEIRDDLRYPLIIKPGNSDNSIGITNDSVVTDEEGLRKQLNEIVVKMGRPALIEEYVEGDEYDVSIIGNDDDLRVLPLSRSIFNEMPAGYWHIYPYDAKWKKEDTPYDKILKELPAKIPNKLASLITEIAVDTYNILDCHDYGRVEIRVDKDGNPFVLELNPNPSINAGDCVPGAAELVGMNYADFTEEILKLAVKRYKDKPPYYHLQSSIL